MNKNNNMAQTLETAKQQHKEDWASTVDVDKLPDYVANMVTDAFNEGLKKGFEKALSRDGLVLRNHFEKSLDRAMKVSSNLAQKITQDLSASFDEMFLKIENKSTFKVAFVLPFDYYLSEESEKLTDLILDTESDNYDETFEIIFTTLPNKKTLDLNNLVLDGYIFKYVGE